MPSDLVKRARDASVQAFNRDLLNALADEIERLTERVREQAETLERDNTLVRASRGETARVQAKLDRALEALRIIHDNTECDLAYGTSHAALLANVRDIEGERGEETS